MERGCGFSAPERPESISKASLRHFLRLEPVWSQLGAPMGVRELRSSYFARVGYIMEVPTVVLSKKYSGIP